jgi:hypothetical protein
MFFNVQMRMYWTKFPTILRACLVFYLLSIDAVVRDKCLCTLL